MNYLNDSVVEYRVSEQNDGSYVIVIINRVTNEVIDEGPRLLTLRDVFDRLALYMRGAYNEDTLNLEMNEVA